MAAFLCWQAEKLNSPIGKYTLLKTGGQKKNPMNYKKKKKTSNATKNKIPEILWKKKTSWRGLSETAARELFPMANLDFLGVKMKAVVDGDQLKAYLVFSLLCFIVQPRIDGTNIKHWLYGIVVSDSEEYF